MNPAIPDLATTFQLLAISLGLGLLVGIQRERVDAPLAGIRTFPLITLFGTSPRCWRSRSAAGSSPWACSRSS